MARVLLMVFLLLMVTRAQANSCCGQTPTSYTVLYQNQKSSLFASYSALETKGRVYSNQDFIDWPEDKKRQIDFYQFQGAVSLTSRSQVFWSTGFLAASFEERELTERSQHLSDTQIGYTYEVLPEFTYSPWRPVIYGSVFLNAPTGRSLFTTGGLSEGADVTGHAQWGGGLGLTLRKVIFPLALTVQLKALQLLEKNFGDVVVSDFQDGSAAAFLNYTTTYWGLGTTMGWTWNRLSSRRVSVNSISSGVSELHTLSFSVQKELSENTTMSFSIADQTVFGKTRNTLVNQIYSINLNYNFF